MYIQYIHIVLYNIMVYLPLVVRHWSIMLFALLDSPNFQYTCKKHQNILYKYDFAYLRNEGVARIISHWLWFRLSTIDSRLSHLLMIMLNGCQWKCSNIEICKNFNYSKTRDICSRVTCSVCVSCNIDRDVHMNWWRRNWSPWWPSLNGRSGDSSI